MISKANEEIHSELLRSERCRRLRARLELPFVYLDWTIGRLEAYHLQGKKRVPKRFLPHLTGVQELLPPGVSIPAEWKTLIRDAIEQCFELQEVLLRVRDPDYARMQELDDVDAGSAPLPLLAGRAVEAPAVA